MSDSPAETQSGVQWGKLLTGAALAAGAILAFTFFAVDIQDSVVPGIQEAMQSVGDAIASGWNWIGQNVIGGISVAGQDATTTVLVNSITGASEIIAQQEEVAERVGSGIAGFITKNAALAAGTAAVAGGLYASRHSSKHGHSHEEPGFAISEEIRKTNLLMEERIKALGLQKQALARG